MSSRMKSQPMFRKNGRPSGSSGSKNSRRQTNTLKKSLDQEQYLTHRLSSPLLTIKGPIRPKRELKYIDLALATYAGDTTGTVTALNLCAEGDDNINRSGREILVKSVGVQGFVRTAISGSAAVAQQGRLLLVWDNATNGVAPTIANILTAANAVSFPNVDNIARFTILCDHKYTLGIVTATSANDQVVKPVDVDLNLNSATRYFLTTAAIGAVQNGGLFLITTGSLAAAGAAADFQLATRVTFHDVE